MPDSLRQPDPLFVAIRRDEPDELSRLLAEDPSRANAPAGQRQPLHTAVMAGRTRIAALLLGAGADVERRDNSRQTALDAAASRGLPEMARLLLAAGADVNARSEDGFTPLLNCCAGVSSGRSGDPVETARMLLAAGADIHARHEAGMDALGLASAFGAADLVSLLLENGAKGNAPAPAVTQGWTPLHGAATGQSPEVIARLAAAGADVNAADAEGMTPLHRAVEHERLETVRALLAAGAGPAPRDGQGRTPFFLALLVRRPDIADVLRAAGAAVGGREATILADPERFYSPDRYTRRAVRGIRPGDIDRIDLHLMTLWRGISVTNPGLLALLLDSLQNAYAGESLLNRVDEMVIRLRSHRIKARAGQPIRVIFNVFNSEPAFGCFGPRFQEALRAVGVHEAQKTLDALRSLDPAAVPKVVVGMPGSPGAVELTDPGEVAPLVAALRTLPPESCEPILGGPGQVSFFVAPLGGGEPLRLQVITGRDTDSLPTEVLRWTGERRVRDGTGHVGMNQVP